MRYTNPQFILLALLLPYLLTLTLHPLAFELTQDF